MRGSELSGSEASPQRFLVIQPGGQEHICQMLPALKALQNIFPTAEITLLIGEAIEPRLVSAARLWVRPLTNLPALLPHLQAQAFTAAFLFTPPGHSPHPLAYACYCAGIPLRIGQSVEFGGGVLSHWVKPLPAVAPGEHYLHLLTAIEELAADQLRPPGQQPAAWPDQKETVHAHASS